MKNARIVPYEMKILTLFQALIEGEINKANSAPKPPIVPNKKRIKTVMLRNLNRMSICLPDKTSNVAKNNIIKPHVPTIPREDIAFSLISGNVWQYFFVRFASVVMLCSGRGKINCDILKAYISLSDGNLAATSELAPLLYL